MYSEGLTEFQQQRIQQFATFLHQRHGQELPRERIWTDLTSIKEELIPLTKGRDTAMIFLPSGGDSILREVCLSHEEGCLELHLNPGVCIVKPTALVFNGFNDRIDYSFYWICTRRMEPSGAYPLDEQERYGFKVNPYEEVAELAPLQYVNRIYLDEGYYKGQRIQGSARYVSRYYNGGDFLIFFTGTGFMKHFDRASARIKLGVESYRSFVQNLVDFGE